MSECKVKPIYALSPQAKGKIERPYRWLQDRIVRTCARENIRKIEETREVLAYEVKRYNEQQVHSTTGEIPIIRFERARKEMEKEKPPAKPEKRKLTNIQKIKLIEETLGREIVPALKADGGDLDLIDIEGRKVYVALRGKCSFCPSSEFTLKQYIESKLREFVSDDIEVEEVRP